MGNLRQSGQIKQELLASACGIYSGPVALYRSYFRDIGGMYFAPADCTAYLNALSACMQLHGAISNLGIAFHRC